LFVQRRESKNILESRQGRAGLPEVRAAGDVPRGAGGRPASDLLQLGEDQEAGGGGEALFTLCGLLSHQLLPSPGDARHGQPGFL